MNRRIFAALAVTFLALLLTGCGSPAPSQEPAAAPTEALQREGEPTTRLPAGDGAVLLEERCTACHSLYRVERAQKSHEEWAQTVIHMVEKGAQLNEDEQATLVDYLAEIHGP